MEKDDIDDLIQKVQKNKINQLDFVLDLSSKGLDSLPSDLFNLDWLTKLNISGNHLGSLTSEISKLKNLTLLDISENQLSSLPSEILELEKLTLLDVSGNHFNSLPFEISQLKTLTQLNISKNQLRSLPLYISNLKNLTLLDVSGNQLHSLSPAVFELKNLTQLNVYWNQLSSLPQEISELRNLTQLNISANHLSFLPSEIFELKNLTQLNVSGNQLSSLPSEISKLKKLTLLDISGNQLSSLPSELFELKNLTQLNISRNQLNSLPFDISKLKNLIRLNVSGNRLSSLPSEIFDLKHLSHFDISGNKLSSFPPEMMKLDLDIKWERIINFWEKEFSWEKDYLSGIYCEGNPFGNPPIEIVRRGKEAVNNYFKSIEGNQRTLNEVKFLLIGDGGTGKTSLLKRLLGEGFDGNENQTQGINIKGSSFTVNGNEMKVNFWDFGGQEIMHATHQFFLSKRSLYILVIDSRREGKPEYWLKHIRSFGGDSPILIVINKIDENPSFDLNRRFLMEKYPSIIGFYRTSCKENQGIGNVSIKLGEELSKIEQQKIMWADSWFNVKTRLENMDSDFITYSEYRNMCMQENVMVESQQITLVDFLNDLGVVLHFNDTSLLDTHVLEPRWITEGVYKIINSPALAEKNGVLKIDMLSNILEKKKDSDYYYPPNSYNFIINLMKKFQLCYVIDEETVLLPELLAVSEPTFEFDLNRALNFFIEYDFFPRSIMPRFIVKMKSDIKYGLQWRTGVVLENKDFSSCAVIKADHEAKRIYIAVNGNQKRDYFSSILFNLREINNSFEKLKAIEKIPIYDEPDIAVRYDHLINLEKMGIDSVVPEGSTNSYIVSDLLGTIQTKRREEELLLEILRILNNKNEEEKLNEIVLILKDMAKDQAEEFDDKKTLARKLSKIIMLQPNIYGLGVNINEAIDLAIDLYFKWKKEK